MYKLSVHQYRLKLEAEVLREFKHINKRHHKQIEAEVQEYANERTAYKRRLQGGDFDPLTADPNCKSCGKNHSKDNDPTKDQRNRGSREMLSYEKRIKSQHGEDGVIEEIFKRIGIVHRQSVEIGVHRTEGNTLHLIDNGWNALLIDGGGDGRIIKREWITAENINDIMDKYKVSAEFDIFSLDIDGNDYFVLKAFNRNPRVIVLEYNNSIPIDEARSIEYNPCHKWDGTNYYGASLKAFNDLLTDRGYALVYIESATANAFFVKAAYADQFTNAGDIRALWKPPAFTHRLSTRTMPILPDEKTQRNRGDKT